MELDSSISEQEQEMREESNSTKKTLQDIKNSTRRDVLELEEIIDSRKDN